MWPGGVASSQSPEPDEIALAGRLVRSLALAAASPQHRTMAATQERIAGVLRRITDAGFDTPNIDFGLVTMRRAVGLPRGAGAANFAIGRCAGWVAHVPEER